MLSALDTQWVTNSNNGLQSHGHPHWRMVQLETAKLLELGCVLPAVNLPHFQMYRWAFVRSQYDWGGNGMSNGLLEVNSQSNSTQQVFIPHVTRIAQLMDLRYVSHSPVSLASTMSKIRNWRKFIFRSRHNKRAITLSWRVRVSTTSRSCTDFSRLWVCAGRRITCWVIRRRRLKLSWMKSSTFWRMIFWKFCRDQRPPSNNSNCDLNFTWFSFPFVLFYFLNIWNLTEMWRKCYFIYFFLYFMSFRDITQR